MDIKGVKPVASREKQTPFGAKTKLHFSGHTAPIVVKSAPQTQHAASAPGRFVISAAAQTPAVSRQAAVSALRPASSASAVSAEAIPIAAAAPVAERKVYTMPEYHAPEHSPKTAKKRRHKRRGHLGWKMLAVRGVVTTSVILATIGGLLAWNGYTKLHKVFHGPPVVSALAPKQQPVPGVLGGMSDGRINILVVGVSGSDGVGADLADTVSLVSIDPVNNKVSLLSIPTDLWVQQPVSPYSHQVELNSVYQTVKDEHVDPTDTSGVTNPGAIEDGLEGLDETVEKVTGVNINYHMLINFQSFQQAVDALGGVNVNVPARLDDPSLAWKNHVSPVLATSGSQQMTGQQALLYVRSRVSGANGFDQLQRELEVLTALKDKALSIGTLTNPAKVEALINAVGENAYTDLTVQNAVQLNGVLNSIDDTNVNPVELTGPSLDLLAPDHVGGLTVAVPTAGQNDYGDIQTYVRGYMVSGYLADEDAPVTIIGSSLAGATTAQDVLKGYGFNVTTATVTTQPVTRLTLVDLSGGNDKHTLQALQDHYGVTAVAQMPAGMSVPPGSAKFVIIEPQR